MLPEVWTQWSMDAEFGAWVWGLVWFQGLGVWCFKLLGFRACYPRHGLSCFGSGGLLWSAVNEVAFLSWFGECV